MESKNVIATEIAEKAQTNGKARYTAYMQGIRKMELKGEDAEGSRGKGR